MDKTTKKTGARTETVYDAMKRIAESGTAKKEVNPEELGIDMSDISMKMKLARMVDLVEDLLRDGGLPRDMSLRITKNMVELKAAIIGNALACLVRLGGKKLKVSVDGDVIELNSGSVIDNKVISRSIYTNELSGKGILHRFENIKVSMPKSGKKVVVEISKDK